MQEKTLEEEFIAKFGEFYTESVTHKRFDSSDVLSFISSREQKAREEGHMEGWKERGAEMEDFIKDNYEKWKEEGRKDGYYQAEMDTEKLL